jgi:hypothetical protein
VVPGLESLAQTPHPTTVPFRAAPVPRPLRGRGQAAPLPSLLEGVSGNSPSSAPSRGGLSPPLHVSAPALLPWKRLLHSFAGRKQPPHRHRGGSHVSQGGHRGGTPASPSSQLHQHDFSCEEEEWGDEAGHQPQKVECSPPRYPPFSYGDPSRRLLRHTPWGLGGLKLI